MIFQWHESKLQNVDTNSCHDFFASWMLNIITSKTFSFLLFAPSPILTSSMSVLIILLWSKAWISFKGLEHSQSHWFGSPQSLHCPTWPCYPPCLHLHPQWLPWNLELDESTNILVSFNFNFGHSQCFFVSLNVQIFISTTFSLSESCCCFGNNNLPTSLSKLKSSLWIVVTWTKLSR